MPFFANLIWQESRLQHDAVSRVGAQGIAQFMPQVAVEIGLDDPFDPRQAIPASARFLRALRQQFGNLGFVAAAYNAGAHRVSQWLIHRRSLPRETQTYVARVTGRSVDEWRTTPPEDSALPFVRLLPCRELPAFADLEHAQFPEAEQLQQAQAQQEQVVHDVEKSLSGIYRRVAARKYIRLARHATARIVRSFRRIRHEATTGRHMLRERRRTADAEGGVYSRPANASAMNWWVSV